MRRAVVAALAALLALAGCVDFVDPTALRLTRTTRLDLTLQVADRAGVTPCTAPPRGGATAVVCARASLRPGADQFGERLPVLSDTLWILGTPLLPEIDEDSTYRYEFETTLPVSMLDDTVFAVRFPTVRGAESPVQLRWVAVGRTGPDSIVRDPGEDVRIVLERPSRSPVPPAQSRFWTLAATGDTSSLAFTGSGVPRAFYDLPSRALANLGGDRFFVSLRWAQQSPTGLPRGVSLDVFFEENLGWRVVTRRSAPTNGGGGL